MEYSKNDWKYMMYDIKIFFKSFIWAIATSNRSYVCKLWITISLLWFYVEIFSTILVFSYFEEFLLSNRVLKYKIIYAQTLFVANNDQQKKLFWIFDYVRVNNGGSLNIVRIGKGDFYVANRVVQRHDICIPYSL